MGHVMNYIRKAVINTSIFESTPDIGEEGGEGEGCRFVLASSTTALQYMYVQ